MSELKAMQEAADEARNAALKARELADLLEDYASCLLDVNLHGRASELHLIVESTLHSLRKAISASDDHVERSGRSA